MTQDIRDFAAGTWRKESTGRYVATVAGHKLIIVNYFDRNRWYVWCDDEPEAIITTKTLRDAKGWVDGEFCYRRWDVIYGQYVNQTSAHWHIGLCTTRPGTYTHWEAIQECKRRTALGLVA